MKQPNLGLHFTELRIQKKLTQKELADLVKVDIRTIQRIECGEVTPRMFTLRLLSDALGSKIGISREAEQVSDVFIKQLRWAFMAGVIFLINYALIIADAFTPLNAAVKLIVILVHIAMLTAFLNGFYLVGKQNHNPVLKFTCAAGMILLPLLGILSLLESYSVPAGQVYLIFTLCCINAVGSGVGFFMEGYQKNGYKFKLYKITGAIIALESIMLLINGFGPTFYIALIATWVSNLLSLILLWKEYREVDKPQDKARADISFA